MIYRGEAPLAAVQVLENARLPGVSITQLLRGPLCIEHPLDHAARRNLYRLVRRAFRVRRRELLFWMPELLDAPECHGLMRACGMRRMVTGYSSIWVDLSKSTEILRGALHGNWRNQLRGGEKSKLHVHTSHGGKHFEWLLDNYETFRRRTRFVGPSASFVRALSNTDLADEDMIVLTALRRTEPVAGILLLCHGNAATYYVSWTGAEGRRSNAHNLLLWRGTLALRERGKAWLDLGGVNTSTAPGVARFKMGMGGELFSLAGTYM